MRSYRPQVAELAKSNHALSTAMRYGPRRYGRVRRLLDELEGLDREGRSALSSDLLARTLDWEARAPGGPPADLPLEERPIIEKADLRDHPDRYRRRKLVRLGASTSGTTGVPVRLVRSIASVAAEQAFIDDLMKPLGRTFRTARIARLRVDNVGKPPGDAEPPYGSYRMGRRLLVLSSNHLAPETAEWFHAELERMRPEVLYTHPSSGEALALFLQRLGRSLEIPLILTSSEMLSPSGRALMGAVYGGPVVDYYGMAERVVFAASDDRGRYHFNPAYGRTELLPVGEADDPGGNRTFEIIATGFWNDAMPLVRYRTGDRVVVPGHYTAEDIVDVTLGLKPFVALQGRDKEHLISPRGEIIVGLTHASEGIEGLLRIQIVQEVPDEATVRVVVDPRLGEFDERGLLENLRGWVPSDIRLTLERVDQVERLPSGKTPFIIRRVDAVESSAPLGP